MASYRELLQQVKAEIDEVDASRARELLGEGEAAAVDVRERDEWEEGHIPGAVHIPRGSLGTHRARRSRSLSADRRVLRRRQPLGLRCPHA